MTHSRMDASWVYPWRLTDGTKSWRFRFRSFSFLFMGDGCMFQPFIFQGVPIRVGMIHHLAPRSMTSREARGSFWMWRSWNEAPFFLVGSFIKFSYGMWNYINIFDNPYDLYRFNKMIILLLIHIESFCWGELCKSMGTTPPKCNSSPIKRALTGKDQSSKHPLFATFNFLQGDNYELTSP